MTTQNPIPGEASGENRQEPITSALSETPGQMPVRPVPVPGNHTEPLPDRGGEPNGSHTVGVRGEPGTSRPQIAMGSAYECCVRMGYITPATDTQTPPDRHPESDRPEGGPAASPWAAVLHAGMMRAYLRTVPFVWLATATAGAISWQATDDWTQDYQSVQHPISPGRTGYVPQASPSQGLAK